MSKLPATIGQKLADPFSCHSTRIEKNRQLVQTPICRSPLVVQTLFRPMVVCPLHCPVCLCGYFQSLLAVWQIAYNGRNPPSQDGCRL